MKKLMSFLMAALMLAAVGCSDDSTEPAPTPNPPAGEEITLSVNIVYCDHEKMSFRFTATHAETVYYYVMPGDMAAMDADYVVKNGQSVSASSKEQVTVEGLQVKTSYQLLVVAVGANQQQKMADPLPFETEDDPSLVIKHTYTRAKGFVLGSGSFSVDLSYADPEEADNFAYDETFLGLYGVVEVGNEYLPAGEYSVESETLVSRYCEYGYESGIHPESGTLKVEILEGEQNKYYRFTVDLVLQNGRQVQATYEGEVDGMPIRNTVYVQTTYTTAVAEKRTDDGSKWQLKLSDAEGNVATLDLYNAFAANYLAQNVYTISTSSEATDTEFGPSEFDGTTSTFEVAAGAGEGTHKFKTGTLTVDLLWESQTYMLSLYATLENEVVVESEFQGAIEGISLAPSTEVVELNFTTARGTSISNGAVWNVTLLNEAGYDLRFSAACGADPNGLPAGEYTAGMGVGHLDLSLAKLTVPGEKVYDFQTLTLVVTIDQTAKTYRFALEGKIEDGRTYKATFEGEVEGMTVVEKEEIGELTWTAAEAKNIYSDNWSLTVTDSTEKHKLTFDLRTGDSDANYLLPGTYRPGGYGDPAPRIDSYYSEYNSNRGMFEDATLEVAYDAATQEYELTFTVKLTTGDTLAGTYKGLVVGSPEA